MAFDVKEHERLRKSVQDAMIALPMGAVYLNSRTGVKLQYDGPDGKPTVRYLDPMASSAIANALVPMGGIIYRGGHGGGKTTLAQKVAHMVTGIPEPEHGYISGNDDQNVNTLIASFKTGKLLTTGEEEVVWRRFVTSPVKIVDELNRFPPPAQNALFRLLNKGVAEFVDYETRVEDFVLMATENPNDPGTYPLSRPFVDRFGLCIPAPQIASAQDQYALLERPDEKLVGLKVDKKLSWDELKKLRKMVSEDIDLDSETKLYAIYLTQAISTCIRADGNDKSHNALRIPDRCKGCHFDTANSVCQMTQTGISGRAALDLQRYAKAYAWVANAFKDPQHPSVQPSILEAVAPYAFFHRLEPNETRLKENGGSGAVGAEFKYVSSVVARASQGYASVRDVLVSDFPEIMEGEKEFAGSRLEAAANGDIVLQTQFAPLARQAGTDEFREFAKKLQKDLSEGELNDISRNITFGSELEPAAKEYLMSKVREQNSRKS
ncbi:MAG: AAA family ATPase [Candidatus Aenigmarchaeota archaeon]|nr:AAA family ATPase [Candidatus Aenigmarchaeota archaeon]